MELTVDDNVSVTEHGPVMRVRLTGTPPALSDVTVAAIHRALRVAEANPAVKVVVIQSDTDAFCTGMDFADRTSNAADSSARFFSLLRRFTEVPLTVVSVVDGRATGGGVGLAAASDLVLAGPQAEFILPEAIWGLLPCCVLPFLIRRIGFQAAYAMALTTLPVDAQQAHRIGLADEVCADSGPVLRRLVARTGRISRDTIAGLKDYAAVLHPIASGVEQDAIRRLATLLATSDVQRKLDAFRSDGLFPRQL